MKDGVWGFHQFPDTAVSSSNFLTLALLPCVQSVSLASWLYEAICQDTAITPLVRRLRSPKKFFDRHTYLYRPPDTRKGWSGRVEVLVASA